MYETIEDQEKRRKLEELLSQMTLTSQNGEGAINGQPNAMLTQLMGGMPENYVQRGNNPPIPLQSQNALQRQLDYSSNPIEYMGQKGRYLKGDPFTAIMADGSRVRLGVDEEATRARQKEDLDIAKKRAELQRAQIEISQANQPKQATVPAGYRMTADGNMEAIPGGPADAKTQALAQRQADGATDVDIALGTLRDAYDRLEAGGGIPSTKNGALSNAAASISSSGIGQATGKLFGTDNQSARNDIAMARPALLASLMKATGMSAKQMDSNAELKLWLSTATDPTLDVESNRRALANIEKKFLKPKGEAPSIFKGDTAGRKVVRTGTAPNGRKVVQYSDGSTEYAD